MTTDSAFVRGTVSSFEGEALTGAVIIAERGADRRITRADSSGQFEMALEPGVYVVTASFTGFAKGTSEALDIATGSGVGLRFELQCQSLH